MSSKRHLHITGQVQGVGFRPFIYRTASLLGLKGYVCNQFDGVHVEVQGDDKELDLFEKQLNNSPGRISTIRFLDPTSCSYDHFEIVKSRSHGENSVQLPRDLATCVDCLDEMNDSGGRRYHYPFINCTQCGPRYSILKDLPYDRKKTSMNNFPMCSDCQKEYEDPMGRRFHCEPNACWKCGPMLSFCDASGRKIDGDPIVLTVGKLKEGCIVAVKGLGGYHLFVDAKNSGAMKRLRQRKSRPTKPFALMAPNLEVVKEICHVSPEEQRLLCGSEAPIVLLKKFGSLCPEVAFDLDNYGVMLPYTPLHHLLMEEFGDWLVATSGNMSEEAICFKDQEAIDTLGGVADYFCQNNRPIVQPIEDSVVRVVAGRPLFLRRARGYAPTYFDVKGMLPGQITAFGGDLKNTTAFCSGSNVELSPFQGDLSNLKNFRIFEKNLEHLQKLRNKDEAQAVCDLHPDYHTHQKATALPGQITLVQHHLAHIASVMAEWELKGPLLGMAFDGTGFGMDETIWGGEWITVVEEKARRFASLLSFELIGGERAAREPWRVAMALAGQAEEGLKRPLPLEGAELEILERSSPRFKSSSMGRLFDGVSWLMGFHPNQVSYEGEAAIWLEGRIEKESAIRYPVVFDGDKVDWRPMIRNILRGEISPRAFHQWVVDVMVDLAARAGHRQVVLSGGCFQNSWLLENGIEQLQRAGHEVYWPLQLPPNDGGLSLGQLRARNIAWEGY